ATRSGLPSPLTSATVKELDELPRSKDCWGTKEGIVAPGAVVFSFAHRLSTVRRADCIYVIQEGGVVEAGTHDELVARPDGVYRTLSDLQFDLGEPEGAPKSDGDNGSADLAGNSARQPAQPAQ